MREREVRHDDLPANNSKLAGQVAALEAFMIELINPHIDQPSLSSEFARLTESQIGE